jgi:hypothetical protein
VDEDPRERARRRYAGRCGYCGVSEEDVGASLTIDHHCPRARGGGDEDENLVYCCPRCNEHKGSYWHETDPPHIRLLHPLRDDRATHLAAQEDGQVHGLTSEGMFLIHRLRLNRPQLVAHRLHQQAERQLSTERDALRERVRELQGDIAELHRALEGIETEIDHEGQ